MTTWAYGFNAGIVTQFIAAIFVFFFICFIFGRVSRHLENLRTEASQNRDRADRLAAVHEADLQRLAEYEAREAMNVANLNAVQIVSNQRQLDFDALQAANAAVIAGRDQLRVENQNNLQRAEAAERDLENVQLQLADIGARYDALQTENAAITINRNNHRFWSNYYRAENQRFRQSFDHFSRNINRDAPRIMGTTRG